MISNMDNKPHKRGGKRNGAGRPRNNPEEAMTTTAITVDSMTLRKLAVLGEGNVSEGVRRAADVAYDRYQSTP